MKQLHYISVQPRLPYYAWQVEVMINNFISNGINPNHIVVLVAYNPNDSTSDPDTVQMWDTLCNHYNTVQFHFYEDTRSQPIRYISSIRPNILKQHWKRYPEMQDQVVFYHDCDMIFTRSPERELSKYLSDDVWYLSDTVSYIGYKYIMSKGEEVYTKMCDIVGMPPVIPKILNSSSGGAQYIIKNVDSDYWHKVELDSERLFHEISIMNQRLKEETPDYHELQIWCADMWAVLWNGWLRGNETRVVDEMRFCWATDPVGKWDTNLIYHNAGVVSDGECFYKGIYMNRLPYDIEDTFSEKFCSKLYFKQIKEVGQVSCLKTKT